LETSEHRLLSRQDFSDIGIVIVFGISGVGKTTACASFVSRHPEVLHISAGALLRAATDKAGHELRTGNSEEIQKAQILLGDAFAAWRSDHKGANILIDPDRRS